MIKIDDEIIEGTGDLHSKQVKKFVAMEELGELIQAIAKSRRDELNTGVISHKHHVNETEEIADVLLICKTLMYIDGIDEDIVQSWIDYKQTRQMFRDFKAMEKEGVPAGSERYYHKCEEVYDDYCGDETALEDDVPQI